MREVDRLMAQIKLVDSYLEMIDWRIRKNANMSFPLQGLNDYLASSVVANYWLNKLYPSEVAEAHRSGNFHIHNPNVPASCCCGWDLPDLLMVGSEAYQENC